MYNEDEEYIPLKHDGKIEGGLSSKKYNYQQFFFMVFSLRETKVS